MSLPTKEEFLSNSVIEPLAVRLAGLYDVWDRRDPDAERLQYGLRLHETQRGTEGLIWDWLLRTEKQDGIDHEAYLIGILRNGAVAQAYAQGVDASICKALTWLMEWEGLKFLCVNHARFNSLLFAARDVPETGHDALLGFRFDGKQWMVSLYHAAHRKDIDLSEIAKKHGGGGHRGAAGFVCAELPFKL